MHRLVVALLVLLAGLLVVAPATASAATERARIIWNQANDIDLHIWDEAGNHAYWGNKEIIPDAALSADITNAGGPEVFTDNREPSTRSFGYQVCYYANDISGAGPTEVTLTFRDAAGAESTDTFTLNRPVNCHRAGAVNLIPDDIDTDGDTVFDESDNCPTDVNSDQSDADGDGFGDICDTSTDSDGDGVADGDDNCPGVDNPGQEDANHNGVGDACEVTDTDGDGVPDNVDNCDEVDNPDQADTDGNGVGDACDSVDTDSDGIADSDDNCPGVANGDQADTDDDGIGDACDELTDSDGDSVGDEADNCPVVDNPGQADADDDGIGDACDPTPQPDADGDGVADSADNCRDVANAGQQDADGDGIGDACDAAPPAENKATPQQQVQGEPAQSPQPVLGETVVAGAVGSGTVKIRLGNGKFRTLGANESIPLGSEVDATKGRVRLTSASGPGGKVQTADFYQGAFIVTQTKGAKPITQLKLSAKLACATRGKASSSAKGKKVRRLWGDGKGRFRTRGRRAAATVRGTKWLTEDRCDRTKITVRRGSVTVRDFVKRKTKVVKKGRSYVARAKK
jgi:thrombospondin type 3 repeat protein